jgi:hypothetical protein
MGHPPTFNTDVPPPNPDDIDIGYSPARSKRTVKRLPLLEGIFIGFVAHPPRSLAQGISDQVISWFSPRGDRLSMGLDQTLPTKAPEDKLDVFTWKENLRTKF